MHTASQSVVKHRDFRDLPHHPSLLGPHLSPASRECDIDHYFASDREFLHCENSMRSSCPPPGRLYHGYDIRPIVFLAVLGLFLNSLVSGLLYVSLPVIAQELDTTISLATWTVTGYLLTLTVFALCAGRLTRMWGFRNTFLFATGLFTITCVLCGLSEDILILSFFRFVQGIGAGLLYAMGPLVVRMLLPPDQQGRCYGLIAAAPVAALLVGQLIGGWIVTYYPWQGIFFIQIPFCIVALYYCFRFPMIPRIERDGRRMDVLGLVTLFLSLFLFMLWMNQGSEFGWGSPQTILLLGTSIIVLLFFLYHEKRTSHPLFERKLLGFRAYLKGLTDVSAYLFIASGTTYLLPFLLITGFLIRPDFAGVILLIQPLVMVVVSVWGGFIIERHRIGVLMAIGWALCIGALLGYVFGAFGQDLILIGIAMFFSGLSMGLYYPAGVKLTMDRSPQSFLEDASDFFSFGRTMSQTLGIAFFETIYSEVQSGVFVFSSIKTTLGTSATALSRISFTIAMAAGLLIAIAILYINRRDRRDPEQ
jgi:MFS family permease